MAREPAVGAAPAGHALTSRSTRVPCSPSANPVPGVGEERGTTIMSGFCDSCGSAVDRGAAYCERCGAQLPEHLGRRNLMIGVIVAVVAAALVVASVVLLASHRGSNSGSAGPRDVIETNDGPMGDDAGDGGAGEAGSAPVGRARPLAPAVRTCSATPAHGLRDAPGAFRVRGPVHGREDLDACCVVRHQQGFDGRTEGRREAVA